MLIKMITVSSVTAALLLFAGCSKDSDNITAPPAITTTTTTFQGVLSDPILALAMGTLYNGSTYKYSVCSNDSFTIQMNVGFGWALVETGTFAKSGVTYTFSPKVDKVSNPTTHLMENAPSLRSEYTGTMNATADTLKFATYNNIGDNRPLGALAIVKQAD